MPHQISQPIFGINFGPVPIYPIMLFIAFIAGVIVFKKTFKKKYFSRCVNKRIKRSFFWGGIFGVLGSNIITWMVFDDVSKLPVFQRLTQGGFSFYFGLISFLIWATIFLRINKINLKFALNKIVSPILTVQLISRIGCSLAGCCFGRAIEFSDISVHIPIRETEALFALVLLIVLHNRAFGSRLKIYLFSYSIFRFFTDFFRGDDQGKLFGIPFFSPTQIVAFFVIFISAIWLFARPLFKLFDQEEELDNFKKKIRDFFDQIRIKVFRRKEPYAPVPFNYVEPKGTKHPLKIIIAIVLVISILSLSVIYINPLNFDWFEDIKDEITYTFFKRNNVQNEVGAINGADLLRLYGETPITSDEEAMEFAKSYDQWKDFKFANAKTKRLSNGNNVYIFQQEFDGKPIIGRNRVLVTDKENKPLYIAGDEASLSVTNEITPLFAPATTTLSETFGNDLIVLEKTECWYDTGNGLVDAYHTVLSKDGQTPTASAVVLRNDEKVVCITDPETHCPKTPPIINISSASGSVSGLLEKNDTESIKKAGKVSISSVPDSERTLVALEKALCLAFDKLDVSAEQYRSIIESAIEIAELIPSLSMSLYREILCEEAHAAVISSGENESFAQDVVDTIAKAFKKCDIDTEEDECVSNLTSDTRKSKYKHSINYASDSDAFHVTTPANHTTTLTLETETPVQIEIYDTSGRAVVSMYVEEEETIMLYPEDGTDFDFRVSDCSGLSLIGSASDYEISLESEEEKIPEGIESTLSRITDSYNNSFAPIFFTMYMDKDSPLNTEETLAISLLAPFVDSIATDCGGMGESVDSAKTMIAGCLTGMGEDFEAFAFLKGSEMELSYVDHEIKEDYTAVKAHLLISLGETEIHNGYIFLRLEDIEYDLSAIPEEQRGLVEFVSGFLDDGYCITDANDAYLYEIFGDTADSISGTSDIDSLYDLWDDTTETIGVYPVALKTINTERAVDAGHSPEKIASFERYTARYNLTQIKSMRAAVQIQYEVLKGISENGDTIKGAIDLYTNPLGFFLDKFFEKYEAANALWKTYKLFKDTTGFIIDEASGPFFEACGEIAVEISYVLDEFDQVIAEYEAEYASLSV